MDTNPTELRVAGATADKQRATLYLEDGTTLILQQGDHRLKDLLEAILPIVTKGEIAVISLESFSVYATFEKKSGGLTKFFKVAKDKVSGWFGRKEEPKVLPTETQQALVNAVAAVANKPDEPQTPTPEPLPAHAQDFASVMEHGTPVGMNDEVAENEVMVAVVGKTVIKGVDAIKPLIDHAVKSNSPEAVQRFLERCAAISATRNHTVDDLMRFLEKGDLPLAADGSIIAYKMLRFASGGKDVFVDCHTGRIRQRVGSYVCVSEKLVDLNRRNECSNGLHIARRGYLNGFGGDVCVLCKIDPEDVMVVPHGDPNKVRVKGYHILAQLSDDAMRKLKRNVPMTDNQETLALVHQAINGQHIGRIERVEVTQQSGQGVVTTKLKYVPTPDIPLVGSPLSHAAALDDERNVIGSVDPRELNKQISQQLTGNDAGAAFTAQTGIVGTKADLIVGDEISEGESTDDEILETDEEAEADAEAQAAIEGEPLTDDQVSAIISSEPAKPIDVVNDTLTPKFIARFGGSISHANAAKYAVLEGKSAYEAINKDADLRALVWGKPVSPEAFDEFCRLLWTLPNEADEVSSEDLEAAGEKFDELMTNQPVPVPEPVTENKAQRDARIKREKRAAKKTAEEDAKQAKAEKPLVDAVIAKATPAPAKAKVKSSPPKPNAASPSKKPAKAASPAKVEPAAAPSVTGKTKAEQARALYVAGDMEALKAFKKSAKKGWSVLGFSDAEEKKILG